MLDTLRKVFRRSERPGIRPNGISAGHYPPELEQYLINRAVGIVSGQESGVIHPLASFTSRVSVFATGGTFDRMYIPETGDLEFGHESVVPELLYRARSENCTFEQIMNIDSAEMRERHRKIIFNRIMEATEPGDRIVITHGTDTMIKTARFLIEHLLESPWGIDRSIVLTGAMTPYSYGGSERPGDRKSDALANFTGAVAVARILPPGVWIHMNSYTLNPHSIETDDLKFIPGGGDTALRG
jgi:L-asparaginase